MSKDLNILTGIDGEQDICDIQRSELPQLLRELFYELGYKYLYYFWDFKSYMLKRFHLMSQYTSQNKINLNKSNISKAKFTNLLVDRDRSLSILEGKEEYRSKLIPEKKLCLINRMGFVKKNFQAFCYAE